MITCSSLQDKDPLVNVSCGQIMKRADEKEHEVETKRPIELQLVTFQRQMESKLEEIKNECEKEITQLKKLLQNKRKKLTI